MRRIALEIHFCSHLYIFSTLNSTLLKFPVFIYQFSITKISTVQFRTLTTLLKQKNIANSMKDCAIGIFIWLQPLVIRCKLQNIFPCKGKEIAYLCKKGRGRRERERERERRDEREREKERERERGEEGVGRGRGSGGG